MAGPSTGTTAPAPGPPVGVGPEEYATGDERLLAAGTPAVRVCRLAEPFVSFGVGMRTDAPILSRARRVGLPVVARRSGGTALLHEAGDLAWTLVVARTDPRLPAGFPRAYAALGRGPARWLRELGLAGEWVDAPGLAEPYCTLGCRGSVLASRGRIVGGAAQHVARDRVLHHGTISVTLDRRRLAGLLGPASPAAARLGSVAELGGDVRPGIAERDLARAIAEEFGAG